MAKRDKYHPDYKKMYPGEDITPTVLSVLKQSDRKMKYMSQPGRLTGAAAGGR